MRMLAGIMACARHFDWQEEDADTGTYLETSQVLTYGMYPKLRESTNTIPQRETVAGDAYCKSPTCTHQHVLSAAGTDAACLTEIELKGRAAQVE